jgi:DNA replication and repair protein RecF
VRLAELQLHDFRNVERAELVLSPRTTILAGENGQGKTNLLEAVYLLVTLRPLRAGRLAELVRFGASRARVGALAEGPGGGRRLAVEVVDGGRQAYLDGKPLDRIDDYFQGLAAVCFSPDDLLLVKSGPELRRRFLDRAAWSRWPAVLAEARDYLRALRERNAALRTGSRQVEESFREPLVRTAARLLRRRHQLLAELAPRVARAFAEISGPGAPPASVHYRPASGMPPSGTEEELAARLAEVLALRLGRDTEKGYTSAGPHMDDVSLGLGDRGARTFASQGQQRALVLALKIAEIDNLTAVLGRPPLLLLDDVSSELDPAKNRYLLAYLSRLPGQAVLTTTDRHLLAPAAGPGTVFYEVARGTFTLRE